MSVVQEKELQGLDLWIFLKLFSVDVTEDDKKTLKLSHLTVI